MKNSAPSSYSSVSESLENQNFIVIEGDDACPGSGIQATTLHQGGIVAPGPRKP